MTLIELIGVIGLSHWLQPPLTILLAGRYGVNLRANLIARSPLAAGVLTNMAFASVFLPTSLGTLLAFYAADVLKPGPTRATALLLSGFWCWRLYRQVFVLGPAWPNGSWRVRALNAALTLLFAVQGPGLALLLLSLGTLPATP